MSSPRTHVIDLGCMPREELIEIAKKQANQIREKNKRISAMETFIESVTGAPAEESLSQSSRGYQSAPMHNSSTETSAFSAGSGTATDATASASQLRQLQRELEEQQVQHSLRVSELEEQLRERQREYDQLQAKVDTWKTKVMTVMMADQERIRGLEAQLAAATAPSLDSGEPVAAQHQQQQHFQAQVSALQQELYSVREALQQAHSQLQEQHCSSVQPTLPSAAATSITESFLTKAPPAVLSPPPSLPSTGLFDNTLSAPPAQMAAADIPPEVLEDAVQAKLALWKERVKGAMLEDKNRIQELEAQVAALETATNAAQTSAEEHATEMSRLQGALETAERERENATVAMNSFRENMEEWKEKAHSFLENGEMQRRALEAEVQRLKEDQLAAAAPVERKETWSQTDVAADVLENSTTVSPVAAAVQDVEVQASVTTDVPFSVPKDMSLVPSPVVLPELHLHSLQALLGECERVAAENKRLHRAVAQLFRFREEVMRGVRAVATPPGAAALGKMLEEAVRV
ncbi:hypothetical protein LPMP_070670 [Leishmania panamensis]|uniref:Uncharacterized protein n=1 Tax=Leishmania panamensis TaxID=5679 RepID=A0A088RIM8_LEIPA|nr:hypothetical protein LPMP_070670 [Leishmania panamensis]AIN95753.1 hypothetical protein LPMP_070670 [Leishmania panamensis]